jgi:hypothetical protein
MPPGILPVAKSTRSGKGSLSTNFGGRVTVDFVFGENSFAPMVAESTLTLH